MCKTKKGKIAQVSHTPRFNLAKRNTFRNGTPRFSAREEGTLHDMPKTGSPQAVLTYITRLLEPSAPLMVDVSLSHRMPPAERERLAAEVLANRVMRLYLDSQIQLLNAILKYKETQHG
jgi:hypothetical protein